jgi:transposase
MPRRADGCGRPWQDSQAVLNGILWVLRTGAQWADLLERYPPYQICHRRFQRWVRDGTLERILEALARDLRDLKERGGLDLASTNRIRRTSSSGCRTSCTTDDRT